MSLGSRFVEESVLNNFLNATVSTSPASVFVALHTANPTDDNSAAAEPVGNGYARVQVTAGWTVTGNTGTPSEAENASVVEFPVATGSWGTLTHFALYDLASGGNLLFYGPLTSSIVIADTETARFVPGDLKVTAD